MFWIITTILYYDVLIILYNLKSYVFNIIIIIVLTPLNS